MNETGQVSKNSRRAIKVSDVAGCRKKWRTTNNNQQINRNCAFRSGRNRRIAFLPAALAPAEVEHQQVDTPEPVEVHLHRSPVVTGWYWISVKWRRFRRSTFICFVLLCYVFVCCFFFFSLFCRSVIYIYFFFHSLKFPFPPPPRLFASVCCYPADFICCRCRCFLFSRRNRLGIFNGTSCHSKIYFYTFHWLWPWLLLKHHSRKPKGGWTSSWVSLQREKNRLVVVVVDFRVVVSIRYFHRHWFHH